MFNLSSRVGCAGSIVATLVGTLLLFMLLGDVRF